LQLLETLSIIKPMSAAKIERQDAFTGTRPVDKGLAFDPAALEVYLGARIDGFRGPLKLALFKGGQSNPTYLVTTPDRQYVLRRKPPGKLLPSAHAVDREFRVISTLWPLGFPIARPHLLCLDDAVIGTAFYVMDFVAGRVVWEPHMPGFNRDDRTAVYDGLNATIANLHCVDFANVGLADFGKPEGYVARQIKRWSEQYRLSQSTKITEMERLMAWLPGACPDGTQAALVHGDFRLDNVILDKTEPKILCVLDWELSTLGDPWGDFTYHLMQWAMPPSRTGAGTGTLVGHDLDRLGIPAIDDYISAYCKRTGFVRPDNLDFYFAYNFFRLAAILQGIAGRARDGTAASAHAQAQEEEVLPLAQTAWQFAQKAGAR
jgi:aminoglycoside phosphotransferase (APT) family kinase protein